MKPKIKKRKFNINNISNQLPMSYQKLAAKIFPISDEIKNRTASFKNYKSGRSRCHNFYKPISKLFYK